ncbi:2-oxoglutarate oxidoreductase [Pseudodesulfovibrio sp. JC047]|uniref:thiamine pyrophosphate-dependent enzyme n=1 Tax=Pseudodesulfovibrio sp. JC047 TaxID=2683199 RepID=UPI0013D3471A|nr:thiamine pyrophosphate-dependent enzyme [Pseudodesulfovibrio sp. JC047]NDV19490.1 2-oxoglutarate oxidoreductase [Pseudodesulfovibrio sp. JC047]
MQTLADYYGKTLKFDKLTSYCPGCGHGIVTRLVAETIEAMGIREKTMAVVGIGCGGFSHHYLEVDAMEAIHGRSPASAIGYKIALPDHIVFTYQGDGDTSAIGLHEIMHAANRGMPITCIMVNNSVFGMTGGQMSPTSIPGQVTSTTATGRDVAVHGYPLLVPEMMRAMQGVSYLARESVVDVKSIKKAAKSIRNAFECQVRGLGFSFVEVISPCPTGLHLSVPDAYAFAAKETLSYFKPQVFKNELEKNDEV